MLYEATLELELMPIVSNIISIALSHLIFLIYIFPIFFVLFLFFSVKQLLQPFKT